MSKAVKITRVEDIRPGDRVTLVWNSDDATTLSGIVCTVVDDRVRGREGAVERARELEVGDYFWRLGDGPNDWHVTVAWRSVPDDAPPLPTEPGSVIAKATIRGEAGHAAFLDDSGQWRSLRPVGGYYRFHHPEDITAWEPGRIVPESEVGHYIEEGD